MLWYDLDLDEHEEIYDQFWWCSSYGGNSLYQISLSGRWVVAAFDQVWPATALALARGANGFKENIIKSTCT